MVVAAGIAADQVGVDSTFPMLIVATGLAATLGGVAPAFGIGSGPIVSNIIASYYVRRMYRVGVTVQVGAIRAAGRRIPGGASARGRASPRRAGARGSGGAARPGGSAP